MLLEIEQSYPDTTLKDDYRLGNIMRNARIILMNTGVNLADSGEPYDAIITIKVTGEALGNNYSLDQYNSPIYVYSGASLIGEITFSAAGQPAFTIPLECRQETKDSVVAGGIYGTKPEEAPFWNIWDNILFQGFRGIWGADVILANLHCEDICIPYSQLDYVSGSAGNNLGDRARTIIETLNQDELTESLSNPNGHVRRAAQAFLKTTQVN